MNLANAPPILDGHLMPDADVDNTVVIGAGSGHIRTTKSWVLGRLLRDFNDRMDKEMENEKAHIPPGQPTDVADKTTVTGDRKKKAWEALRLTIFEVDENPPAPHGVPTLDLIWYSGFAVVLIQLGIAAIPWGINKR